MNQKTNEAALERGLEQIELVASNVCQDVLRFARYKHDDVNRFVAAPNEGDAQFAVRRIAAKECLENLIEELDEQIASLDYQSHLSLVQMDTETGRTQLLSQFRSNILRSFEAIEDDVVEESVGMYLTGARPAEAMGQLSALHDSARQGHAQAAQMVVDMFEELEAHRVGANTPAITFECKRALEASVAAFNEACTGNLGFMESKSQRKSDVLLRCMTEVYAGHISNALDLALYASEEYGAPRQVCGSLLLELGVPQPMEDPPEIAELSSSIPDGPAAWQMLEVMRLAKVLRFNLEEGVLQDRVEQVFEEYYEERGKKIPGLSSDDYAKALQKLDGFEASLTTKLSRVQQDMDGWTDKVVGSGVQPFNVIKSPPRMQ